MVVQEVGESPSNNRRSRPSLNDDPSFCATLYTAGGVGELYQRRSVIDTLCRPPPHQDWGRAGAAGNRFARDEKELRPQLPAGENNYPENGLVKPPRLDTRALSLAPPEDRKLLLKIRFWKFYAFSRRLESYSIQMF
jgi:hypothetical protein